MLRPMLKSQHFVILLILKNIFIINTFIFKTMSVFLSEKSIQKQVRQFYSPPIYCNHPVLFSSFLLFCERNVS